MAIIEKQKYSFSKGEIVHLDSIYNILAFVLVEGLTKPHRSKGLTQWDADTSEHHKVLKDFTVEVIVKGGKK
jgi:hypothetical protein